MRIVLFVEGHTEKQVLSPFLKKWLDVRVSRPLRIDCRQLGGVANYRKDVASRVRMVTGEPGAPKLICVAGLLDLHRAGFEYPRACRSARDRASWAAKEIQATVANPIFRQFFAVHELEAWLLSDSTIFRPPVQAAVRAIAHPEEVDDTAPPAKWLDNQYRKQLKQSYKKTTDGRRFFSQLDPDVAATKCPHLKELLDALLTLAKDAGC